MYLYGEQLGSVWTTLRNVGSGPAQGLCPLPSSLLRPGNGLQNLLTLGDVTGAEDLSSVHLVRSMRESQSLELLWPPSAAMGKIAECALKTDDGG